MTQRNTRVKKAGVSIGEAGDINLVEGNNITLTVSHDTAADEIDVTIAASGAGGSGHTIAEAGVALTARATLNFGAGFDVADDAVNDETDVTLDASEVSDTPTTQAFGDTAVTGAAATFANSAHKHAMPADPVTAHAAAVDPHTGYRLESADHTHQTTGAQAGTLDHGLALTGLIDDDHTQYILKSLVDAAGDLLIGSAADTVARLARGNAGEVLEATASTVAFRVLHLPVTFSKTGTLTTGVGATRWYNDTGRTLTFDSTRASVGTAPTGAALIVDVNKDGTTIFTTQASRPTIAVSTNTAQGAAPDVTTIANGSFLTVDIDQIGSTVAGSDLSVQIWLKG